MAYTKTIWKNDQLPAINEGNLNNIENGIEEAHNSIDKVNNNIGNLSNLNTDIKDNLVNAINNVNKKSLLKISKSSKSSFELGKYGFTKVPLDVEEIKIGEKFALQDGSIVNVSNETLNVLIIYTCVADNNIENGYMLAGVKEHSYTLIAFSTATNMSSSATFTEIATMKPNDKITMRIGKHSATSVGIETKTSIFVKEM